MRKKKNSRPFLFHFLCHIRGLVGTKKMSFSSKWLHGGALTLLIRATGLRRASQGPESRKPKTSRTRVGSYREELRPPPAVKAKAPFVKEGIEASPSNLGRADSPPPPPRLFVQSPSPVQLHFEIRERRNRTEGKECFLLCLISFPLSSFG